jgi:hypothetical protein
MLHILFEVDGLFLPVAALALLSIAFTTLLTESIILRNSMNFVLFALSTTSWIIAGSLYVMVKRILELINRELLYHEAILSDRITVGILLIVSGVFIIAVVLLSIIFRLIRYYKEKREKTTKAEAEK